MHKHFIVLIIFQLYCEMIHVEQLYCTFSELLLKRLLLSFLIKLLFLLKINHCWNDTHASIE